jgi:serine/threonine protein kinase
MDRVVGEGGMATVYLVRDVRHGRKVALEVLKIRSHGNWLSTEGVP